MPSPLHNGITELFRLCPQLAPELIRDVLYLELPQFDRARSDASNFGTVNLEDYQADVLILLESDNPLVAVAGVITEVQRGRDRRKWYTWPDYTVHGRARHECPFYLLVLAVTPSVARFCNRTLEVGHPGFAMRPLVVGPAQVPRAFSEEEAKKSPALAVLSVIYHGKTEYGLALAKVVVQVALATEDARKKGLFLDLVFASVGEATRKELEAMVGMEYQYQSKYMKKMLARAERELRQEGRKKGLDAGVKKGRAEAVLLMLKARGLPISKTVRQAVARCGDIRVLDLWIRQALHVQSAEQLLDGVDLP